MCGLRLFNIFMAWACPTLYFGGGGGGSDSQHNTTTNNNDNRIATQGPVATGGSTINNADAEAINKQNTEMLAGISRDNSETAKMMMQIGGQTTADLMSQTAQVIGATQNENKLLLYLAGIAAAGAVAYAYIKKGAK